MREEGGSLAGPVGKGTGKVQGPRCTPSPGGPAGHAAGPSGCLHCPPVSRTPSESTAKELMGEEGEKHRREAAAGQMLCPGGCSVSGPQRSQAEPGQPSAGVLTQELAAPGFRPQEPQVVSRAQLIRPRVLCHRFPPVKPRTLGNGFCQLTA